MMKRNGDSGQVLMEYALMLAVFAAVAGTLLFLLGMFSEISWRILSLIAWEP